MITVEVLNDYELKGRLSQIQIISVEAKVFESNANFLET